MGSKFLVPLWFALPHHFAVCIADERASRVKHPDALEATEHLKILALYLHQLA